MLLTNKQLKDLVESIGGSLNDDGKIQDPWVNTDPEKSSNSESISRRVYTDRQRAWYVLCWRRLREAGLSCTQAWISCWPEAVKNWTPVIKYRVAGKEKAFHVQISETETSVLLHLKPSSLVLLDFTGKGPEAHIIEGAKRDDVLGNEEIHWMGIDPKSSRSKTDDKKLDGLLEQFAQ